MSWIKSFFSGFGVCFLGFKLIIKHPSLTKWYLIPFIIYILSFIFSFKFGMGIIGGNLAPWLEGLSFMEGVRWLPSVVFTSLYVALFLGLGALLIYVIFSLATIISTPFNTVLAEATVGFIAKKKYKSPLSFLSRTYFFLKITIKKLIIFSLLGLCFLGLSFVPLLSFISIFFILFVLVMDSLDYAMEYYDMSLKNRLLFPVQNFFLCLGMVVFASISLIVPGFILILFPFQVIGASALLTRVRDARAGEASTFV